MKTALACLAGALAMTLSWSAHAALTSVDGGLGVYDSTQNLTWTSDADLMATQASSYSGGAAAFVAAMIADSGGVIHDTPNAYDPTGTYTLSSSDFHTSTGSMTWWGAQAWVNYLNATDYGNSTHWALPTTVDTSNSGGCGASCASPPAASSSQLAQLFYGGLGQVAGTSIATNHNASYSLFSNVQYDVYWSGTEYSAFYPYRNGNGAWAFDTINGAQGGGNKYIGFFAMAASPGQLGATTAPEIDPASAASGFLLLAGSLVVLGGGRSRCTKRPAAR